jgi:hypothetical protein
MTKFFRLQKNKKVFRKVRKFISAYGFEKADFIHLKSKKGHFSFNGFLKFKYSAGNFPFRNLETKTIIFPSIVIILKTRFIELIVVLK